MDALAKSLADLRELGFTDAQIERWALVGFRLWYKRTWGTKPKDSREKAVNRALASLEGPFAKRRVVSGLRQRVKA